MKFIETPIKDLFVIEPPILTDHRGYFYESYNARTWEAAGLEALFVQDNQSMSERGVLRGLHAQSSPHEQGKLVRVIQGKVRDVAIDVRKDSPTYGQHFSIELSGDNHLQLWIPAGFLHGFVSLEDQTIFHYKVTGYFHKASEIGVRWDDPSLAIPWESWIPAGQLLLSEKDKALPLLSELSLTF